MKRRPIWIFTLLSVVTAFTAISWISVKDSQSSIASTNTSHNLEVSAPASAEQIFEQHIVRVYETAELGKANLSYDLFKKAFVGYLNLKSANSVSDKQLLSVIDFNLSSTAKRLWIIDLAAEKLLFNTFVAHGQGSGGDMATKFSNIENSHQSSLGFYVTSDIYFGKHGLSMKLDGMDKDFNSNAKDRSVVIHGASYVSQQFINETGRLGRSHGCPALPVELTKTIIENIKGKTTLFIDGPAQNYNSQYSNQTVAMNALMASSLNIASL